MRQVVLDLLKHVSDLCSGKAHGNELLHLIVVFNICSSRIALALAAVAALRLDRLLLLWLTLCIRFHAVFLRCFLCEHEKVGRGERVEVEKVHVCENLAAKHHVRVAATIAAILFVPSSVISIAIGLGLALFLLVFLTPSLLARSVLPLRLLPGFYRHLLLLLLEYHALERSDLDLLLARVQRQQPLARVVHTPHAELLVLHFDPTLVHT